MIEGIDAYPLCWPAAWPRSATRYMAPFYTPLDDAIDGLRAELRRLHARDMVISSNVPRTMQGMYRASWKEPEDPGVAVYFTVNGAHRCIPCDRWNLVRNNVQAIRKSIEALRGLDRWGTPGIVAAAFAGFAALPASTAGESWWSVLGVAPTASEVEIESAYRRLAKQNHPDIGGDAERFHRIAEAYRVAKGRLTA